MAEIFYCRACGHRVTNADLEKGKALRASNVVLCGPCVKKTTPKQPKGTPVTPAP